MGDEFVTKEVHAEFVKRIEAEETRQNRRLSEIDEELRELRKMATNIERLSISVETMAKELAKVVNTVEEIKDEPADNWRKAVWIVLGALIAAAVGYALRGVGL